MKSLIKDYVDKDLSKNHKKHWFHFEETREMKRLRKNFSKRYYKSMKNRYKEIYVFEIGDDFYGISGDLGGFIEKNYIEKLPKLLNNKSIKIQTHSHH